MVELVRHQSRAARKEDEGKVVSRPVGLDHWLERLEAVGVPRTYTVEERGPLVDATPALRVVASECKVRGLSAEDEYSRSGPEDLRCKLGSLGAKGELVWRPKWQLERLVSGEGVAEV